MEEVRADSIEGWRLWSQAGMQRVPEPGDIFVIDDNRSSYGAPGHALVNMDPYTFWIKSSTLGDINAPRRSIGTTRTTVFDISAIAVGVQMAQIHRTYDRRFETGSSGPLSAFDAIMRAYKSGTAYPDGENWRVVLGFVGRTMGIDDVYEVFGRY